MKKAANNKTAYALHNRNIRQYHSKIAQCVIKNNIRLSRNWMGVQMGVFRASAGDFTAEKGAYGLVRYFTETSQNNIYLAGLQSKLAVIQWQ
ncbi:hypothetical protein AYI70_g8630 [Smittium culicis]|uniref:Uncharacterized protein n=1 Tax=Smittium culicis TaxID=133412 RepID=A0A1R1XF31_9FUNG|nr:hypothetical protein AYI70_g8630 [Smittium culicis]